MATVLTQMAIIILAGVVWQSINPTELSLQQLRNAITAVVYNLFLPALVLLVLWQTELGGHSLRIAFIAACCVLSATILAIIIYRILPASHATAGALILAAGFPNVMYLGLPILEGSLGPWARSIAIQYDLFACTPLFFTVAILVAQTYGRKNFRNGQNPIIALFKVPALWAAAMAILFNFSEIPLPQWLYATLNSLSHAVIPLMLFSLGLALSWKNWHWKNINLIVPVLILQLIIQPLLAWTIADASGFTGKKLLAIVLEAGMPSMVLGIMLCDRYRLDAQTYAMAVTSSTAFSMISLPIWFNLLN